ncbi:uncharacterized protein [Diabrotica undecimpunctata]|uniref:uncharacterized protein n=1 Tax=Diabrotica undecimpunctata TaxID=50387 RepID=UPI003B63FE34
MTNQVSSSTVKMAQAQAMIVHISSRRTTFLQSKHRLKRREKHTVFLENGQFLITSGVALGERAEEVVGCLIHSNLIKNIQDWEYISERILKKGLITAEHNLGNIIVIYGINHDERAASKDLFWDKASEIIDSLEGNTIVLGDLNGQVGVKDVHKYTREVKSRGERSIIDYVLVNRSSRQYIKDIRVKRGAEIYSDHYLVVARTSLGVRQESITKETKKTSKAHDTPTIEVIRSHKLADKETANNFENYVKNYLTEHAEHDRDLDQNWQILKEALLNGGKQVCGITRNNRGKKCTNWWNNNIKAEMKSMKAV